MTRRLVPILLLGLSTAAVLPAEQFKYEAGGAPPSELSPAVAAMLQDKGHKALAADGKVWAELWFVKEAPKGKATSEGDTTWKTVTPLSLVGAIRWPAAGYDRRGQVIKPGVYTLRYGLQPVNGDHLGVAPQRDFLVMSPADADVKAEPLDKVDDLMAWSKKVSAASHPAVLSMWLVESNFEPGLGQAGEHDWALQVAVGDAKIAVVLVGKAE